MPIADHTACSTTIRSVKTDRPMYFLFLFPMQRRAGTTSVVIQEKSLMPGFHHSVAVLPFLCTVAVAGEIGNAGNVFPYT